MTGTGRQWDWTADGWQPVPAMQMNLSKKDLTDGEAALNPGTRPVGKGMGAEVPRKRDSQNRNTEDKREWNGPVRPASGGSRGTELPRGGAR